MGQRAMAIMYGTPSAEGVTLYDWDDEETGLVAEYRAARRSDIKAYDVANPSQGGWDHLHGEDAIVPRSPYESDLPALGFYVACAGSGLGGIPYLEPCEVAAIPEFYAESYTRAVQRWTEFTEWCRSRGTVLPDPRLYITETETA